MTDAKKLTERQGAALDSLVSFGYLPKGNYKTTTAPDVTRAIVRFQRHAARPYRLPIDTSDIFRGLPIGRLDNLTLAEIDKWTRLSWKLPLGRFEIVDLPQGGKLRSDAASAWGDIVKAVTAAGGTLEGPYGDTIRGYAVKAGDGASRHSFHYAARAVDIKQALAGGRQQRYFVAKDPQGERLFWRIWCKVDTGKGQKLDSKDKKYFDFFERKEKLIPAGNYIDLTQMIEKIGTFERIRAHAGWETHSKRAEWWHFQYSVTKQATIQDEMELIGISEQQLRSAGWTTADLDHAPG